ncbi:MAG: hypothetical protein LIO58_00245, partial [Oscillospiraceae bacterium]|nr:hypothetical protein [Oscillospiraceae bacterium]
MTKKDEIIMEIIMKVAIYTLGCKVNQYETQAMETMLKQRGACGVPTSASRAAYVIMTCTVR